LLSEVPYATFANYSPRGTTELSKKSRRICSRIKVADRKLIDAMIREFQDEDCEHILKFLEDDRVLVPIPGSAPLKTADSIWTPFIIAQRLVKDGFGREVQSILKRRTAVPKSAFAKQGERPTIQRHYDTMEVDAGLLAPEKVTLIDDVLTRGRTSYAAAWRIHDALPNTDIKIFSVIRTQGLIPEVLKIKDPSVGVVSFEAASHDVDRRP